LQFLQILYGLCEGDFFFQNRKHLVGNSFDFLLLRCMLEFKLIFVQLSFELVDFLFHLFDDKHHFMIFFCLRNIICNCVDFNSSGLLCIFESVKSFFVSKTGRSDARYHKGFSIAF
jgi:hypothetical protein